MAMYLGNQAVKIIERSKNLIPFPYEDTRVQNGGTMDGVTYIIKDDGTIILNGASIEGRWYQLNLNIPMVGDKTYTISGSYGSTIWSAWRVLVECKNADGTHMGTFASTDGPFTFTTPTGTVVGKAYMYIGAGQTFNNQVFKPMLNEGKPAPYGKKDSIIPFRIRSGVNMGRNPKNLIPFPYVFSGNQIEKVQTKNGVTFIVNDDSTITANGTATARIIYYLFHEVDGVNPIPMEAGYYRYIDGTGNDKYETHYISGNYIKEDGTEKYFDFMGNTLEKGRLRGVYIVINEGVSLNNVVFKPVISKGTKALPYYYYD